MKKISKIIFVFLVGFMFLLTGCGKKKEDNKKDSDRYEQTIGYTLENEFKAEIKKSKDIKVVAENISKSKSIDVAVDVVELNKSDFLTGFKSEIKNYKSGYVIRPIISTIPFIAYVFESDDSESLLKDLKDNADLRWNICTTADNMNYAVVDNYVFFTMTPKSFD